MTTPIIGFILLIKPFADGRLELNLNPIGLAIILLFVALVMMALLVLAITQWVALFKFMIKRGGACETKLTVRPYQRL